MNPVFTINFRREAWQREMARSRARVISLGAWLFYFGALVVIFGLYGLNFVAVLQHTRMVERQAAAQRASRTNEVDWSQQTAELSQIERGVVEPNAWRRRLQHISTVLPPNARLESVEFNPGGVVGGPDWYKLVLSGVLRAAPNEDRMRGVANLVRTLQGDSLLAADFHSIRLASTHITETTGNSANFVIECRP